MIDYILIPNLAVNILIAVSYAVIMPIDQTTTRREHNKLIFVLCLAGLELFLIAIIGTILNKESK